ncbi:glycine zipper 2TM domain-containing protein [Pseudoduganella chitinolytica]|uniref:Glycine zipper 2TM domain-containing protein n=1 Tax=Pseudoduganella chitinolytica TaxID=34070 RepID=A0ABY8BNA5_9BURK|nr:glycine zipper 2TM domain-containing protein [Pseudoduganella chitinolytica]WEF35839.1 glycine zipper 2TM domain-containing protein [Pseudoduganella chitinolytica]
MKNIHAALLAIALTASAAGAQADPHHKHRACKACGKVTNVYVTEKNGDGGATGVIVGGLAGGLLGNQVGSGTGKSLATVAGAVGGAYAGKHIEGRMNKVRTWNVKVRFDDGKTGTYHFRKDPHLRTGERVRRNDGTIVRS